MISYVIDFIKTHNRHLPAAALIFGLVWDMLTLGRPDQLYSNLVMLSYLMIAGFCILLMARRAAAKVERTTWLPLITQFSFGNLTGGLLVLYIGSATLSGNWPFLLMLVSLLIGNEVFTSRYARLRFNVTVYYFLVLLYLLLIVPVLSRSIKQWTFILSAILSIAVIFGFLYLLRLIGKEIFLRNEKIIRRGIFSILVTFGVLYYLNLIPPVPLAVRDIGIFHRVERQNGDFVVTYEKAPWYAFWRDADLRIYLGNTDTAFCFSAIFAPTDLETPIYHKWEKYNSISKRWESLDRFFFPITGGRVEGYRGFTEKTVSEGKWRCRVETERGALLGLTEIEVVSGTPEKLVRESR